MALEGSLQDMSLVDLFRTFHMGQKTGLLMLVGAHKCGIVYVATGRLTDAVVIRNGDRRVLAVGEEAVFQLLQWEEATFTFRHDQAVVQRPGRITRDNTSLMLEGLRRRTRPVKLQPHQVITLDTQLELAPLPSNAESTMDLGLEQWRLLNLIATSPNVRALCVRTGMTPDTAIRMISELVAIGLIDIAPMKLSASPAALKEKQYAHTLHNHRASVPRSIKMPSSQRELFNAIKRRISEL